MVGLQDLAGRSARPARPATRISSWPVSLARKSAENRPFVDADHHHQGEIRQVGPWPGFACRRGCRALSPSVANSFPTRRGARWCCGRCAAPETSETVRRAAVRSGASMPRGCRARLAQSGRPVAPAAHRSDGTAGGGLRHGPVIGDHAAACCSLQRRAPAAVVGRAAPARSQRRLRNTSTWPLAQVLADAPRPAVPATTRPVKGALRTSNTAHYRRFGVAGALLQAQVCVGPAWRCAAIPARGVALPSSTGTSSFVARAPGRSRGRGSGCRPCCL